jgi:Holliday junction resolvase|tara:strand:- start:386 stop:721 length:336 start_codon:yes stop_codon:yes gene_type:complete
MGKDANHETIVREFMRSGADVVNLSTVGKGVPDILVGFAGFNQLVEIKLPAKTGLKPNRKTSLSLRQKGWHNSWRGRKPVVIRTPEEAELLLDELLEEATKRDKKEQGTNG